MFCKKDVLRVSFLTKLQASAFNFIKKETLAQVFSCGFCEICKNTFFTEHLRTTASGSRFCWSYRFFQICNFSDFGIHHFRLRPATLLKRSLWHRCFPVNFAKFLRTPFFAEHRWWLLLSFVYFVMNICSLFVFRGFALFFTSEPKKFDEVQGFQPQNVLILFLFSMQHSCQWKAKITLEILPKVKWDKVFKSGPSKICGRQSLKNFARSILEYFVPYTPMEHPILDKIWLRWYSGHSFVSTFLKEIYKIYFFYFWTS